MNEAFWRQSRVLVGGGCGFLGSYLVPELLKLGARVTVVDNLEHGSRTALQEFGDDVEFIEADLRDLAICDAVTRSKDAVINLAARAFGMEYSRSHNGEMLVHNLLCTLGVLDAARRNGVERLMIVSSSCVYPDDAPVPTPELPTFTGMPESVNEGYGWAKRIQELAGNYYAHDFGMKITTVRPFNPYGGKYLWGSEQKAHVIPALVKRILDGEDPLVVWGSGRQRRNFVHARDAVRLMLQVMERDVVAEPINIGFEDEVTIQELVALICDVAERHPKVVFDTRRPEGRFRKAAASGRLKDVVGIYRPEIDLRSGIREMVDWYFRTFR